jgi:biotin transport system substrate-specific component
MSPKEAASSILAYLLLATAGFPVFGGVAKALWFSGAGAGYLFAFPVSAYCIAYLRTRIAPSLSLLIGSALYLVAGFLWLIPFVGINLAFVKGVLVFLPSELCKAMAALGWMAWENRK